jgi:hypothetical protein
MGYGAHYRLATDGDEKESISRYCGAPQTTKVDDVWQYEAAREYGPGRVGTDE